MMWLELLLSSLLLVLAFVLLSSLPSPANPLQDFYQYQSLNDGLLAASSSGAPLSDCAKFFGASHYAKITCYYSDAPASWPSDLSSIPSTFDFSRASLRRVSSIGIYRNGKLQFLNAVQD